MAINPETSFPGKITASSAKYPFGKARNVTLPGDGTGTPWDQLILNDIFGFQQALLSEAGIVPTGSPDEVGDSQYLNALSRIGMASFDTKALMAAKKSADLEEGQLVFMISRSVAGDKAAGAFRVTKTDISTEVTGDPQEGIFVPFDSDATGASGGFIRNNLGFPIFQWWGAIGDFGADDTVALQAGIDFGQSTSSIIYLLEGTYKTTAQLNITSTCGIIGVGRGSIIKGAAASTHIYILAQPSSGLIKGLLLRDFSVDGNGGGQLDAGLLQLNNCEDFLVDNIFGKDGSLASAPAGVNGVAISSPGGLNISSGTVQNCEFQNFSKAAINWTGGSKGGLITGNLVHDITGNLQSPGIQVNGGFNGKVVFNEVFRCEGAGIIVAVSGLSDPAENCRVAYNTCYENGQGLIQGAGVHIANGFAVPDARVMVNNNYCHSNGVNVSDSGIKIENQINVACNDNFCFDNTSHGIFVDIVNNITLAGNHCWNNNRNTLTAGAGISMRAVTKAIISGNMCFDDQGTQTQEYGLSMADTCDDLKIYDNDFDGNELGDINGNTGFGLPKVLSFSHSGFKLSTTDATLTNQFLLTLPDDSAYLTTVSVIAVQDTGANRAAYVNRVLMFRNGGGATIQGAISPDFIEESDATWITIIDGAANLIRNRVQGAAAQNVSWKTKLEIESQ